jgi:hypothetical protein
VQANADRTGEATCFVLLTYPFHPLIYRPARRRRSPKPALPRVTPSPWTCMGRSSSTIPTVRSPRAHSPPFPAQFRAVFLRLLGFNRVPWSQRDFGLVCFVDVVTEFIEGLVETYSGLQYLDGFPQVNFESVNKLDWF